MIVEIRQEATRFLRSPSFKSQGESGIDIERLAAGIWMGDDGRIVDGVLRRQFRIEHPALQVVAAGIGRTVHAKNMRGLE